MSGKFLYHFSVMEKSYDGQIYRCGSIAQDSKVINHDDYLELQASIKKKFNLDSFVIINLTLLHEPDKL